jgi:hypothetical protein
MNYLSAIVLVLVGLVGCVSFAAWLYGLVGLATYHADRTSELERNFNELVKTHNREIETLRSEMAAKTHAIGVLQQDALEIYECLGLLDERVVMVSEKLKSRASKKRTKNIDKCINVLHASLSKEVGARRHLQKLVESQPDLDSHTPRQSDDLDYVEPTLDAQNPRQSDDLDGRAQKQPAWIF